MSFATSSLSSFIPPSILPYSSTIVAAVVATSDPMSPWTLAFYYVDSDRPSVEFLASVDVSAADGIPIAFSLDVSAGQLSALGKFQNTLTLVFILLYQPDLFSTA